MTANAGPKPETNKDLFAQIESLRSERKELDDKLDFWRQRAEENKKVADTNADNGAAWKKLADERGQELDAAIVAMRRAQTESAELRGYIRRVNELDPENRREIGRNEPGPEIDRRFDPAYLAGRKPFV